MLFWKEQRRLSAKGNSTETSSMLINENASDLEVFNEALLACQPESITVYIRTDCGPYVLEHGALSKC